MHAKQFNSKHPVGSHFIYQPSKALRGGKLVKTVDVARDMRKTEGFEESTVVEINLEPYFANVNSLTPTS
jgi:hypothetical protein